MPSTFLVKLHGVSFSNGDGTSRQELIRLCSFGERLSLKADPANVHDRNAVAVFNHAGRQLGWLPSDARDAASILRGERIEAIVEKKIGGPRLITLRRKADTCDKLVEAGNSAEKVTDPVEAIDLYYEALKAIIQLNSTDPQASAHRYKAAPLNRLTLLLDRASRWHEAVVAMDLWRSVTDPIGLPSAELSAVTKRMERIRKGLAGNK